MQIFVYICDMYVAIYYIYLKYFWIMSIAQLFDWQGEW